MIDRHWLARTTMLMSSSTWMAFDIIYFKRKRKKKLVCISSAWIYMFGKCRATRLMLYRATSTMQHFAWKL